MKKNKAKPEKTEPKPSQTEKPSQTGKNQAKIEPNRKNQAKPV
jgi:hypothetical protein